MAGITAAGIQASIRAYFDANPGLLETCKLTATDTGMEIISEDRILTNDPPVRADKWSADAPGYVPAVIDTNRQGRAKPFFAEPQWIDVAQLRYARFSSHHEAMAWFPVATFLTYDDLIRAVSTYFPGHFDIDLQRRLAEEAPAGQPPSSYVSQRSSQSTRRLPSSYLSHSNSTVLPFYNHNTPNSVPQQVLYRQPSVYQPAHSGYRPQPSDFDSYAQGSLLPSWVKNRQGGRP